jgi:hypothetical protein
MAGQEAHVYKYADRSQLFFECQIAITIKEPNAQCVRPQCSEPSGKGAGSGSSSGGASSSAARRPASSAAGRRPTPRPQQRRRLRRATDDDSTNTLDVRVEMNTLDIDDEVSVY